MTATQAHYRLVLAKKTARMDRETLSGFIRHVLLEFGGYSLLSDISIRSHDDCTFHVVANEPEHLVLVKGALALQGNYKTMNCRFTEEQPGGK